MNRRIQSLVETRLRKLKEEETSAKFAIKTENEVIVSAGKRKHIYAADTSQLGILQHVPQEARGNSHAMVRLAYALYLYTLRIGDFNDMRRLHSVDATFMSGIKDSLFGSYNLVLYKLATIRCLLKHYNPNQHWHQIGDVFEGYGLNREDRLLYAFFYHNDADRFINLLSKVEDPISLKIDGLKREVEDKSVFTRLNKASISYSSYKLSFVAKGNRFDVKDMAADLRLRGVQAYYWVRPFYDRPHAINYACSAMRGWTNCLIDHYTDPSRERIRSTDEGFENTVTDYSPGGHSDHFSEDCMLTMIDIKRGRYDEHLAAHQG